MLDSSHDAGVTAVKMMSEERRQRLRAGPQSPSSAGLSPSIYMKRLLEVASEHGVDTSAVLRSINMSQEALESSDIYYTVEQHVASIKLIQEAAAIPGLGLLVGLRISIADLGVMGYAMLSSPTLRKAMDVAIRFQSLTDPVLHVSYRVDGNDVVVVVEPLMLLGQAYRYDVEETLAIWQRILGNFFGSGIGCTLVKVTWPQPAHDAMYRNIFRCPVVYSQDVNEFHFPRYLMDQPLGLANDHAARICEEECARLLKSLGRGQTILDSVRRILINSPGRFPDLPTVAKKLRISPRNLRRRLADASTSFREISADVRIHIATQYLSDTSLTVEQIGFLVGYGEASNFHRAFKRHAGLTPLDFRKQHSSA